MSTDRQAKAWRHRLILMATLVLTAVSYLVLATPVPGAIRVEATCDSFKLPTGQTVPIETFTAISAHNFEGKIAHLNSATWEDKGHNTTAAGDQLTLKAGQNPGDVPFIFISRPPDSPMGDSNITLPAGSDISGTDADNFPTPTLHIQFSSSNSASIEAGGRAINTLEADNLTLQSPTVNDLPNSDHVKLTLQSDAQRNLDISLQAVTNGNSSHPDADISFASEEDSKIVSSEEDYQPAIGSKVVLSNVQEPSIYVDGKLVHSGLIAKGADIQIAGDKLKLDSLAIKQTQSISGSHWSLAAAITGQYAVASIAGKAVGPRKFDVLLDHPLWAGFGIVIALVTLSLFIFSLYKEVQVWLGSAPNTVINIDDSTGVIINLAEVIQDTKNEIKQDLTETDFNSDAMALIMDCLDAVTGLSCEGPEPQMRYMLQDIRTLSAELKSKRPRLDQCQLALSGLQEAASTMNAQDPRLDDSLRDLAHLISRMKSKEHNRTDEARYSSGHKVGALAPTWASNMSQSSNSITGDGNIMNIATFMINVTNMVNQNLNQSKAADEAKMLVKQLTSQVAQITPKIDSNKARQLGADIETLSKEMAQTEPRKKWYDLSLTGIKEAAESIGEIGKPLIATVSALLPLLLPK